MKHKIIILLAAVSACISFSPVFADAGKLVQEKGCVACHDVTEKKIGPAYKEVAAKYKDDAGAAATLAAKIKAGGSGVWGQIPMPPQAALSDEEIQSLVKWVLSQ